jgi:hypothetical protein
MGEISLAACTLALCLITFVFCTNPASSHGALAVGEPASVATQGFAFGVQWNKTSDQEASERALELCRIARVASEETRALCKVIRRFQNECVAVALGAPDVGYSVAENKDSAEMQAMAACLQSAGPGRRGYCKVVVSGCDESARETH